MNLLAKTAMVAAAAIMLPAVSAQAATLMVDVTGVDSVGELGDAGNTVRTFNIGANSRVTGVSYAVSLTAFDPSWLSEVGIAFTNSAVNDGVLLRPGFQDGNPGTGTYSETLDLIALNLDFTVDADGVLRLEFYEDFDDNSVNPDGRWDGGTLTFTYSAANAVPEPATWAMMIGGFGLVGGAMRRRAKVAVSFA